MVRASSVRPVTAGRYRIVATSVARVTDAASPRVLFFRTRSMRLTHDARVIPAIGSSTSTTGGARSGASTARVEAIAGCILPRSIPASNAASVGVLGQVELRARLAFDPLGQP